MDNLRQQAHRRCSVVIARPVRKGNRHENSRRRRIGEGKPLTVTEVELEGPKASDVLVEVKATGICHATSSRYPAPRKGCSRPGRAATAPRINASLSLSCRTTRARYEARRSCSRRLRLPHPVARSDIPDQQPSRNGHHGKRRMTMKAESRGSIST
jgi:hypothetical protein